MAFFLQERYFYHHRATNRNLYRFGYTHQFRVFYTYSRNSITCFQSSCSFTITCLPGTPANTDYFPLTQNSRWSYDVVDIGVTDPDSLSKRSDVQSTILGNTYRNFRHGYANVLTDVAYYRKQGNDYYEYILADTFSLLSFDVSQYGEILFLKENAPVNTTWESQEFLGNINGVAGKMKYTFKIDLVNTNLTVNGVNYTNVIKVSWKCLVDDGTGGGYVDDAIHESYYARGIGLIKYRRWDATGPSSMIWWTICAFIRFSNGPSNGVVLYNNSILINQAVKIA